MTANYILKELCRYNTGTWADIIYRNALLYPNQEAFGQDFEARAEGEVLGRDTERG